MPSNIEIKAAVNDLNAIRAIAERLSNKPCLTLQQKDIFFNSPSGRLKLRVLNDDAGQLIYYERPDCTGPSKSNYNIYNTSEPLQIRKLLTESLGEIIIVEKNRQVYLIGQTRIHLDEVTNLGTFIELEVVLCSGQEQIDGQKIAIELMNELGIKEDDLISCSYADLLTNQVEQNAAP